MNQGGLRPWGELAKKPHSGAHQVAEQIFARFGGDLDTPWRDLPEATRSALLYGGVRVIWRWNNKHSTGQNDVIFEGEYNAVCRRYKQTKSEWSRQWYTSFMSQQPCPACRGQRLRPESAAVTVGGRTMTGVTGLNIGGALAWIEALLPTLNAEQLLIGEEVLKEIRERLMFLVNVGLHYLSLDRPAPTLSGGEGQRIRLASQIGCGLVGVLYVLDEPSIGLHSRDNRRLLDMHTSNPRQTTPRPRTPGKGRHRRPFRSRNASASSPNGASCWPAWQQPCRSPQPDWPTPPGSSARHSSPPIRIPLPTAQGPRTPRPGGR